MTAPSGRAPRVLVLLQNAYSPAYAGGMWPREAWLRALWRSRSGRRLRVALDGLPDVHVDNTTPAVGTTPDSLLPIDRGHVAGLLAAGPRVVLACGRQAERAAADWAGPLVVMPHPAWRLLADDVLHEARRQVVLVSDGRRSRRRIRIRPIRGGFEIEPIPTKES